MNRFWTGVRPALCPHCNQPLEFEPAYAVRLRVCNEIFRYSILTIVLVIVIRFATDRYEASLGYVLVGAVFAALGAVIGSATGAPKVRLQVPGDA